MNIAIVPNRKFKNNIMLFGFGIVSLISLVFLSPAALAQNGQSTTIFNSPQSSGVLDNPSTGTATVDEEDVNKPKRRSNAGKRDDILNKGDPYSFDDNKGVAVKLSTKESETQLAFYAKCMVKSRGKSVKAFLDTLPTSPASTKSQKSLVVDQCLNGQNFNLMLLQFDDLLLRAALYDQNYSEKSREIQLASLSDLAATDIAAEYNVSLASISPLVILQRKFGDCVVRLALTDAQKLLEQAIWSSEEKSLINALSPAMANCLQAGSELKFSRTLLRGLLAESLVKFNNRKIAS